MPASTFEQLIATHGDMIARHNMSNKTDFTTAEFINTLANIGRLYATGMTNDLQDAAEHLTAAANYLVDAELDPVAASGLIAHADKRLQYVADLHLA